MKGSCQLNTMATLLLGKVLMVQSELEAGYTSELVCTLRRRSVLLQVLSHDSLTLQPVT
jgi:hypothetical protein